VFWGREIRLLDYIKGVGQPFAYCANDLKRRGWEDAIIYLPHDGVAHNNILRQAPYRALGGGRL
jgi:phage terminase large subunit